MKVYTCSGARQKLAALLEQAQSGDEVRVRRRDGQEFVIRPAESVDIVREVRQR